MSSNMEDLVKGQTTIDSLLLNRVKDEKIKPKVRKINKKIQKKEMDQSKSQIPEVAAKLSKQQQKKYDEYKTLKKVNSTKTLKSILSINVPDIAKDIIDIEKLKTRFIRGIKPAVTEDLSVFSSPIEKEIKEEQLVHEIKVFSLRNRTICSIDGSFVTKSFYGMDISLFRTIGVIYEFNSEGIPEIHYFPDDNGVDNYKLTRILHNASEEEAGTQISLERAKMEVQVAYDMIRGSNSNIDFFILDGSILTEPLNFLFSKNDSILEKYLELINFYKKLYDICERKDIILVGVVKDTRSSTFRKLLARRLPRILKAYSQLQPITEFNYRKLMKYFSDLDLFNRLLRVGERSCAFSINSAGFSWLPRQLEFLKEEFDQEGIFLDGYKFYAMYIKSVDEDLPLRVEFFLNNDSESDQRLKTLIKYISGAVYGLSSKIRDNAIPVPQLEAHMRCKLSTNDMNTIMNILEREITTAMNEQMNLELYQENGLRSFDPDSLMLKNNMLLEKRRNRLPF